MENKTRYQRNFLIFSPEDKGYGSGQEPSGYVKMEINNDKGKLSASVQNLKESDRLDYKLYIIKCINGSFDLVCAGPIRLKNSRAELKWSFDPSNVANTGTPINDFNIAAVLGERKDGISNELVCPMAAYKDKKVNWKSRIAKAVEENKTNEPQMGKSAEEAPEGDIQSKFEHVIESRYTPSSDAPAIESIYHAQKEDLKEPAEAEQNGQVSEALDEDKSQSYNEYNIPAYKDMNPGNASSGDYGRTVSPCEGCLMNNAARVPPNVQKPGDTEALKVFFDKYFEVCSPFRSIRKDYKWWRVGSPVQLNNIMYQCNIKTPLLFNSAVMMSHFKYRYLIVGIYTDRTRKREYVVCGIPAMYRVDDKPFRDLCRWVQVEGNTPRSGAFGYWLVYIDGKSGKLLNVN